ncbi:Rne/Rng family ribonuclease [Vaginella massiliensis]|uniref:Rne/Rng family ribonuclease n=1 Tax=Vaginella massiliensis TaxID=1816680 RepID=UPI003751DA91
MNKELVISAQNQDVRIAVLEEGRLMELHQDSSDEGFAVGDIYLGKIKKLAPSLNACFVDIGYNKDAFLHYHDLGPQIKSSFQFTKQVAQKKQQTHLLKNFKIEKDINKNGSITEVFQPGDLVMVQITKEPIHTKGPRITSEISIAGRYIVLVPFSDRVSISQKIRNREERDRLIKILESFKPEGFGVIIRTVAEEKKADELQADLNYLLKKWKLLYQNISKNKAPSLILDEMDRASSILRDNFNDDFVKISVDDKALYHEMVDYLQYIAPKKVNIVKYYDDAHVPIFEKFNIERQIKLAFGKTVTIPQSKGAYLVIEHTEALHVIDVNSGNISRNNKNQEDSAFAVNKVAASEIARQLKLRDMGGIVVVDFIDMKSSEHKKELFEHLRAEMAKDKAKHKILPPSKFGLIQITRQRVRPELNYTTTEENPNQEDEIEAPIVVIDRINETLQAIMDRKNKDLTNMSLHVHPFVAAYLKQGFPSIQLKWLMKYKKWVKIVPRDAYKYLQFNFLDRNKNTLYNESN